LNEWRLCLCLKKEDQAMIIDGPNRATHLEDLENARVCVAQYTHRKLYHPLALATMKQGVIESSHSHPWNFPSTEGMPPRLGVIS